MEKWNLVEGWGGGNIIATVYGDCKKAIKKAREMEKKTGNQVTVYQSF